MTGKEETKTETDKTVENKSVWERETENFWKRKKVNVEEQGREREVPTQIDKERKKDDREENETKECLNISRKCMKEREKDRN